MASITDEKLDETGRAKRGDPDAGIVRRRSSTHPFTGVGAGQFKNYNPEGREEAWRESHNVVLQVAAELGIFGLAVFVFLVVRAFHRAAAGAAPAARRRTAAARASRTRRRRSSRRPTREYELLSRTPPS